MDFAVVACTPQSPLVDVAVGDDFTIGLGYEDDAAKVLSGTVSAIDYNPAGLTFIHGLSIYLSNRFGYANESFKRARIWDYSAGGTSLPTAVAFDEAHNETPFHRIPCPLSRNLFSKISAYIDNFSYWNLRCPIFSRIRARSTEPVALYQFTAYRCYWNTPHFCCHYS